MFSTSSKSVWDLLLSLFFFGILSVSPSLFVLLRMKKWSRRNKVWFWLWKLWDLQSHSPFSEENIVIFGHMLRGFCDLLNFNRNVSFPNQSMCQGCSFKCWRYHLKRFIYGVRLLKRICLSLLKPLRIIFLMLCGWYCPICLSNLIS